LASISTDRGTNRIAACAVLGAGFENPYTNRANRRPFFQDCTFAKTLSSPTIAFFDPQRKMPHVHGWKRRSALPSTSPHYHLAVRGFLKKLVD
jgi:hypothetical protein